MRAGILERHRAVFGVHGNLREDHGGVRRLGTVEPPPAALALACMALAMPPSKWPPGLGIERTTRTVSM